MSESQASVRPKDGESFRKYALKPRGITFELSTIVTPSNHFSEVFTRKDYEPCYKDSSVWLDLNKLDTEHIAGQFKVAVELEENEAHFTQVDTAQHRPNCVDVA